MPEPTDRDQWHLRIALLLNAGRVEEALRQLQSPSFDTDAETFRLRAVAFLLNRDAVSAKAAAQEAEVRAADWLPVRETAALADYYCAISPLFNEWNYWVWPNPHTGAWSQNTHAEPCPIIRLLLIDRSGLIVACSSLQKRS